MDCPASVPAIRPAVHHDEDVTVYFNGVIAFQESGYLTAYKNIPLSQEAMDALTPDDTNIVAIECTNKGGGQYIDFGLTGIRPIPTGIKAIDNGKSTTGHEQTSSPNVHSYNLAGQLLSSSHSPSQQSRTHRQGIRIINGKKILY